MGLAKMGRTGLATLGIFAGGLLVSSPASAAPPEKPLSKPATEITGTAATLHGVLNPKVSATAGYHFAYGSEGSCEGTTTEPGAEATGTAIKVSTSLSGLVPHTKYTFCVVATNKAEEATSGLPVTFETLPVAPLVEEESVSALTQNTASLSALINPELQETTCTGFQYVDAASFAESEYSGALKASCEPEALGAGSSGERASASLTGLVANTTYHFRVQAENSSGLSNGPDQTFLTLPDPPAVSTGEAAAITPTGATISASVNPGSVGPNSDTAYFFQYGATTSYGAQIPIIPGDAGQGTIPVTETASLSALEPGATYHYRIVATNDNTNMPMIAIGKDKTFTTVATPPIVSGVSVSAVTPTAATITATIDPRGLPTRYELELGSTPGELQARAFGNTASAIALVLTIGPLRSDTLYHYKLTAANLSGIAESPPEGAFRTALGSSASYPLAQPPTPSLLATPTTTFPSESVRSGILGTTRRRLTNAQMLAIALKACRQKPKTQRPGCERKARGRYALRNRGRRKK
jgi:hypothetical protein